MSHANSGEEKERLRVWSHSKAAELSRLALMREGITLLGHAKEQKCTEQGARRMDKKEAESKLKWLSELAHDVVKAYDPASDLVEITVVNGAATIRTDWNSANQINIVGHKIGGYDK